MGWMIKKNDVIKALEACIGVSHLSCKGCPYAKLGLENCRQRLYNDAVALIVTAGGKYEM